MASCTIVNALGTKKVISLFTTGQMELTEHRKQLSICTKLKLNSCRNVKGSSIFHSYFRPTGSIKYPVKYVTIKRRRSGQVVLLEYGCCYTIIGISSQRDNKTFNTQPFCYYYSKTL